LGYPNQARQKIHEALTLARQLNHSNTLGWVLNCAAWLQQYLREPQKTQEYAEAAITLGHEHGFPLWQVYGAIFCGWALAVQGQTEEGITQMCQGMALAQDMETD